VAPSDTLTVAVLGTGRQGRAHALPLLELAREGLAVGGRRFGIDVLLCGRDPRKVAALAGELGIERTSSDWRHAVTAPEVGEKPLTGDPRLSEDLLRAAERAGVRHTIIQNMRYLPRPAAAKCLLDESRLGRIFHLRAVVTGILFEPNWGTGLVNERLLALAYRSAHEGQVLPYTEGA